MCQNQSYILVEFLLCSGLKMTSFCGNEKKKREKQSKQVNRKEEEQVRRREVGREGKSGKEEGQ